jgi:uncharacterized iron-regulated membrane protein
MLIQAAGPTPPHGLAIPPDPGEMQMTALVQQQMVSIGRLVQLEGDRVGLRKELSSATGTQADQIRRQINLTESQIEAEKAKIDALKSLIAEARQGTPGVVVVQPGQGFHDGRMFGLSNDEFKAVFSFAIAFPLVVAVAVRLIRRKPAQKAPVALEDNRLARLEQAVESVAIEVERIGESQRFQAKLMAERQPEPDRSDVRR